MSIHTEEDDLKMTRSLYDLPYRKSSKSGSGDELEIEITGVDGVPFGYKGTNIVRKKYFVSLAMGESPVTDAMVKDRSILYAWSNHPMFNVECGSTRINGMYLFPKKILIDYDRNAVVMDFELFDIVENGIHAGYVAKPDNAIMNFEYAYKQDGYKIQKIEI